MSSIVKGYYDENADLEWERLNNAYGYLEKQVFYENESFTEVYFSTPPDALEEVKEAGFEVINYAGVESYELPQYRDATEHLHIVVRKK